MTNKNYNIPDQLITEIAQEIDMGMVCFINPETLELESILGNSYIYGDTEEFNQEIFAKVNKWKKYIHIEPLESRESFVIMENSLNAAYQTKTVSKRSYGMPYPVRNLSSVSKSKSKAANTDNVGSISNRNNWKYMYANN